MLLLGLGAIAGALSFFMGVPPSRDLVLKLGTLVDMARRADPERFRAQLEPVNPFAGGKFVHARVGKLLRSDVSDFGEICQRLQREARKLDKRAHLALIPVALYLAGLATWMVLSP